MKPADFVQVPTTGIGCLSTLALLGLAYWLARFVGFPAAALVFAMIWLRGAVHHLARHNR